MKRQMEIRGSYTMSEADLTRRVKVGDDNIRCTFQLFHLFMSIAMIYLTIVQRWLMLRKRKSLQSRNRKLLVKLTKEFW